MKLAASGSSPQKMPWFVACEAVDEVLTQTLVSVPDAAFPKMNLLEPVSYLTQFIRAPFPP